MSNQIMEQNQTNFVVVNDTHFMAKSGTRLDIFPALLEKWGWVLAFARANNAVILHTGDFFNTPTVSEEVKASIIQLTNFYGVRIYAIYGNHDLLYGSEDFIGRTSLNLLELSGHVSIVWDVVDFGSVVVAPVGVKVDKPAIVLGHGFFEQGLSPSFTASELDIYTKPTCIFLGHDHSQYPPVMINVSVPTILYRNGGFIRQSVDTANNVPTVSFVSYMDSFDVHVVPIPVAKPAVFTSQTQHSIELDAVDVNTLISSLSSITVENKDLNFYLRQVAPSEILDYISLL